MLINFNVLSRRAANRRKRVVAMRNKGMTLAAIAVNIGVSRERVRQILLQAVKNSNG